MFGINKNGTKHKIGIIMPAFFPASRTTYDNTTSDLSATDAQGAIDELAKPTFTEASTRANIASGESFATILGKIKKFFTDLKTVAFTGAYADLSGTPDLSNVVYQSDIALTHFNVTPINGITMMQQDSYSMPNGIKCIQLQFQVTTPIGPSGGTATSVYAFTIPSEHRPANSHYFGGVVINSNSTDRYNSFVNNDNGIIIIKISTGSTLPTGYYMLTIPYQ